MDCNRTYPFTGNICDRTEDLGHLDDDNCPYVKRQLADFSLSGRENIYPTCLKTHPMFLKANMIGHSGKTFFATCFLIAGKIG